MIKKTNPKISLVMLLLIAAILPTSVNGNLAQNPSMEGNFILQDPIGDVAEHWTAWFRSEGHNSLEGEFYEGSAPHEGSKSQNIKWNGFDYEPFGNDGIYQQIDSLQPGRLYRASFWFKGWMSYWWPDGQWGFSMLGCIGADPEGGTDPDAIDNWRVTPVLDPIDIPTPTWYNVSVMFVPSGSVATVFTRIYGTGQAYDPELGPQSWEVVCSVDDVVVEKVEIVAGSTVEATSPIPANGVCYSKATIKLVDGSGIPLAGVPASKITVHCTGSGNTIVGPDAPTDANGRTTARITSTVAETKTVSVMVFGTLLVDTAVVEFVGGPFGPIWYVDDDATGADDGSSWADAFNHLQDALTAAQSGHEIHVAQGNYKPDRGLWVSQGSRYASFQLTNGVGIKGGYAGFGEPDPNARDIALYETVLSGDLAGNDGPNFSNNDENSYHVVTGSGTDETAVLDGFTITGGNANGSYPSNFGGGLVADGHSSPKLIDCTFTANSAEFGGGMGNYNSGPKLTNCTFSSNWAEYGGGMANDANANPTVINCKFKDNSADVFGGGVRNHSSSATVKDCTFTGNSADHFGGGMFNHASSLTLTNCTFSSNWAHYGGGGMTNDSNTNPKAINCTFSDNMAGQGGGMDNYQSSPTLTDCIFTGNSANNLGGGMYNYDLSIPTVTNCTFSSNLAEYGGGVLNHSSSPMVTNCTFSRNSAIYEGGGMLNYDNSLIVTNCVFSGNLAGEDAGGMYNYGSIATLTNCTFNGNSATNGNALACESEPQTPSSVELTNCILWDGGDEIQNFDGSTITITYSDVQGGYVGTGNLDSEPCFVQLGCWVDANDPNIIVEPNEPNAMWVDGNYRLRPDSPCIDDGYNDGLPADYIDLDNDGNTSEQIPWDLDGFERFIDDICTTDTGSGMPPIVDMGAHEFLRSDIDSTGYVNLADLSLIGAYWQIFNCGTCEGADLTCDGNVDNDDLAQLVKYWLAGVEP